MYTHAGATRMRGSAALMSARMKASHGLCLSLSPKKERWRDSAGSRRRRRRIFYPLLRGAYAYTRGGYSIFPSLSLFLLRARARSPLCFSLWLVSPLLLLLLPSLRRLFQGGSLLSLSRSLVLRSAHKILMRERERERERKHALAF